MDDEKPTINSFDDFLYANGIELLPFQKEVLEKISKDEKVYVLYPPMLSRTNAKLFFQTLLEISYRDEEENKQ